jgi:hypothetical protein
MDFEKYDLHVGRYVSFWFQARNYAVISSLNDYGIVFQIYKVIADENNEEGYEPEYSAGDAAFFPWMACPNLKFEQRKDIPDNVSYASYT